MPLAFLDGSVQAGCDGMQNARVLPDQPPLATAEQSQAGVQRQLHIFGVGEEIG